MKTFVLAALLCKSASAFTLSSIDSHRLIDTSLNANNNEADASRRSFFSTLTISTAAALSVSGLNSMPAFADGMDVNDFLKSGQVAMPMGVSGQAGKSKPRTGIIFRDGSEIARDAKTGDVLTEIVLSANSPDPVGVLTSFTSPWPVAKGAVFDVECRDSKTGDAAFLSVTSKLKGKNIEDLKNSFFTEELFSPTGRFSFYGPPTDVKVSKSYMDGKNRVLEMGFSILSQSTGAEIPRKAIVVASVPEGTDEAVMLATSTTAIRWKKGVENDVRKVSESFKAVASPSTGMKVRARPNKYDDIF